MNAKLFLNGLLCYSDTKYNEKICNLFLKHFYVGKLKRYMTVMTDIYVMD